MADTQEAPASPENHKAEQKSHETAISERSILSIMYQVREYTDLKIFAGTGEDQKCFNLHRAVVTAGSKYFEKACKGCFEEGRTKEIRLTDIEPAVFEVVANWMYQGGHDLFGEKYERDFLVEVYAAADYLQVRSLKTDILSSLPKFLTKEHSKPQDQRKESGPHTLLKDIGLYSSTLELPMLRECTRVAIRLWILDPELLFIITQDAPGTGLLSALLLEAFQNALEAIQCDFCRPEVQFVEGKKCQKCSRESNGAPTRTIQGLRIIGPRLSTCRVPQDE
ncbi:hypothetical protein H072_511 [Dactylellina haptotyla CBS 200.50]|uniref:BTB domain-containing protein n=1 Tax=Dactylellina haptotyla (strain CBS 200.50) TaxID=1284197 RepID=S8C173_DACHA|nr:hypothetical protein H072_511 [Dactylellina haptotyla CBS 200.50]